MSKVESNERDTLCQLLAFTCSHTHVHTQKQTKLPLSSQGSEEPFVSQNLASDLNSTL